MVNLSIQATDATDLYRQIRDLAGPAMLEGYPDETLLAEVRQRFAKKGFVVVIRQIEEDAEVGHANSENGDAPEPPKGNKPGRKPKAETPATAPTAPATTEAPKPIEPSSDTAKAMEAKLSHAIMNAAPPPSQDDVKAALNAYAAVHGQMPARTVMQNVGGCPRLMDIPVAKYGAVIEALAVQVAA